MAPTDQLWFPFARRDSRAQFRLFCLPHAGGAAYTYLDWISAAPPEIEICPASIPGREGRFREPPFTSVVLLVKEMAAATRDLLDMPFALFGHSLGALVAYEFARRLEGQGARPAHLFVSGRAAPHLSLSRGRLHDLPEHLLIAELAKLKGLPANFEWTRELKDLLLPIIRADLQMNETYTFRGGPPLCCGICAFGGADDPNVSYQELRAWQSHTQSSFREQTFPGGHFYVRHMLPKLLMTISATCL